MKRKIKAAVNTTRKNWYRVYNEETRNRLKELLDFDERLIYDNPDKKILLQSIKDAEVVLSGWDAVPYDNQVLDQCPDLKIILYAGISIEYFTTAELLKRKVKICTASYVNARPVAEFTLGVILTSLKYIPQFNEELRVQKKDGWTRFDVFDFSGGYYKRRIGLVGFGNITRQLVNLLKPFDFEIFVWSKHMTDEEAKAYNVHRASIEHIMAHCDVISIHATDSKENRHLINKDNLRLMKERAVLINTARGRLINEDDLIEKLKEGKIYAYLDVTYPEPPERDNLLYSLRNCFLTPHLSGAVGREVERLGEYCLRELENWISNNLLENEFDISQLGIRA